MFQITRRADYATRIMIELGGQAEGHWLQAQQIAQKTAVPRAFLHKITADLATAGLVKTFPGPTGGLALMRPANQITLLQILEAIDGPVCLNVCQLRPAECSRDLICPAHTFWGRLQASIVQQLQSVNVAQLAAEAAVLKRHPRKRQTALTPLELIQIQ